MPATCKPCAYLEQRGVPSEHLTQEKTEVYNQLADLNRQIRAERKKLALCREIQTASKQMEEDIRKTETRGKVQWYEVR